MSNAAQKMIKARANLVMGNPFFGTLALRLKMVEDKTVKTSSTDGTVLRYNPDAVAEMPLSKVQGMLAHTVMHPAMLHHTRRGARDKAKWNKACDYSINTLLSNAGLRPASALASDASCSPCAAQRACKASRRAAGSAC